MEVSSLNFEVAGEVGMKNPLEEVVVVEDTTSMTVAVAVAVVVDDVEEEEAEDAEASKKRNSATRIHTHRDENQNSGVLDYNSAETMKEEQKAQAHRRHCNSNSENIDFLSVVVDAAVEVVVDEGSGSAEEQTMAEDTAQKTPWMIVPSSNTTKQKECISRE